MHSRNEYLRVLRGNPDSLRDNNEYGQNNSKNQEMPQCPTCNSPLTVNVNCIIPGIRHMALTISGDAKILSQLEVLSDTSSVHASVGSVCSFLRLEVFPVIPLLKQHRIKRQLQPSGTWALGMCETLFKAAIRNIVLIRLLP